MKLVEPCIRKRICTAAAGLEMGKRCLRSLCHAVIISKSLGSCSRCYHDVLASVECSTSSHGVLLAILGNRIIHLGLRQRSIVDVIRKAVMVLGGGFVEIF